ncbi:GDSL esterase/lipase [Hordeum vulgare]|nr:GDSL esterase/lipase [Hordeum vulgare]
MKLLPAVLCLALLLLVLNPNGVEARPAPTGGHQKKPSSAIFFVFGDDFADNGNLPLTDPVTEMSRQWAYPYGSDYVDADGHPRPNTPSGRFSNYQIQSDFIAIMLGLEEAPPAHARTAEKTCDPSGMTFASAGAGVLGSTSQDVPTLSKQVDTFRKMVKDGTISEQQLSHSVALVAISGNDYASASVIGLGSPNDINAYIGKVTKEIATNVEQLLKLGVTKVLVNNLHPVGCTPSQTRTNNYTACNIFGNLGASIHNDNLKQVMTTKKNVHIIDLYTAFTNIVDHAPESLCRRNVWWPASEATETEDRDGGDCAGDARDRPVPPAHGHLSAPAVPRMDLEALPPPAAPSLCFPRSERRWADWVDDSDDEDGRASLARGEGRVEMPVSMARPQLGIFLAAARPAHRRLGKEARPRVSAPRPGRPPLLAPPRSAPVASPVPSVALAGVLPRLSSAAAAGGGGRVSPPGAGARPSSSAAALMPTEGSPRAQCPTPCPSGAGRRAGGWAA